MLYEIDIRRKGYLEPVDMDKVYTSLKEAGIEFDANERRNTIYGITSDEQPEYVYVDNSQLGQAVKIINNLGYETDEDEEDDDE